MFMAYTQHYLWVHLTYSYYIHNTSLHPYTHTFIQIYSHMLCIRYSGRVHTSRFCSFWPFNHSTIRCLVSPAHSFNVGKPKQSNNVYFMCCCRLPAHIEILCKLLYICELRLLRCENNLLWNVIRLKCCMMRFFHEPWIDGRMVGKMILFLHQLII